MSLERHFIGWNGNLAEATAKIILANASAAPGLEAIDLSAHRVIVPSQFAARLIREQLAIQSVERGGILLPKFQTPTDFLNWGDADIHTASSTDSLMGWIQVLKKITPNDLPALLPKKTNESDEIFSFQQASRLAKTVQKLREELGGSANVNDFAGVAALTGNPEPQRWADLAKLEVAYREILHSRGLKDRNDVRAELALGNGKPENVSHLWLACLSEPQPLFLTAIKRMAEDFAIHILVGADADEVSNFDEWGRPTEAGWQDRHTDWKEFQSSVHVVGSPNDGILKLQQLLGGDKITDCIHAVCACDREIDSPKIAALIHSMGSEAVNPLGLAHSSHFLHQTLRIWCKLLNEQEPDFFTIKEILLVPAIAGQIIPGLTAKGFTLIHEEMDEADQALFRGQLSDILNKIIERAENRRPNKFSEFESVLSKLAEWRSRHRALHWQEALVNMIERVIDIRRLDEGNLDDQFTLAVVDLLKENSQIVDEANKYELLLNHEELILLTLESTAAERFRRSDAEEAVNLPGWIEAPWEPVPHLVIFGLNDHLIPQTRHAHPFLPAQLCRLVGLPTNEARFAAAAFALEQLWRQRTNGGILDIIVPQQDADGNPLRPSRLLFMGPDEFLTARVEQLFTDTPNLEAQPYWEIPEEHKLIPLAEEKNAAKAKKSISATSFKTFLADPAEYWLKRGLGLNEAVHEQIELDNAGFGTLVHGALEGFGSEYKGQKLTSVKDIEEALLRHLNAKVIKTFGSNPSNAVKIQVRSAQQRLKEFAPIQQKLFEDGWLIEAVEGKLPELEIEGVKITGKYDRLDKHQSGNQYRVYDYKTFAKFAKPESKHLKQASDNEDFVAVVTKVTKKETKDAEKRWIDLQLPVYHLSILASLGQGATLDIGYICLPAKGKTDISMWDDYIEYKYKAEAEKAIHEVCRQISLGSAEVFKASARGSEYPLLGALSSRPTEGYMKVDQLGGIRK